MGAKGVLEFFVASTAMEPITGLIAECRRELDRVLMERTAGRRGMTVERDEDVRRELEGRRLLLDRQGEGFGGSIHELAEAMEVFGTSDAARVLLGLIGFVEEGVGGTSGAEGLVERLGCSGGPGGGGEATEEARAMNRILT